MNKELVTIIVPVYNVLEYLDKCIQSLINQTYTNLQIIMIDDGSNDGSGELCDYYAKNDKRIEVYHKENEGVSKARTYGYHKARGKYITFVDSDDWIDKEMIESLYLALLKNNTDLSICDFYYEYDKKTIVKDALYKQHVIINQYDLFLLAINPVYVGGFVCNKLFKKEILDKILRKGELFQEELFYCEDLLLTCQYIPLIESAIYLSKPLYHYRQRVGSATLDYSYNPKILSLCKAYEKLIDIYSLYRKDLLPILKYNYVKININIRYRIITCKSGNEKLALLDKNIKKYFKELICDSNLKLTKKINMILSYFFPVLIGNLKVYIKKIKR